MSYYETVGFQRDKAQFFAMMPAVTCPSGKVAFRSSVDAAIKADRAGTWYGTKMKAYKCDHCPDWHTSRIKESLDNDADPATME